MNSKRPRYIFLAALFAIALAFQSTIWSRVFTSFMTPGPEPDFGLVKWWAIILVLRVVTPLVSLTFGFYVASVRIWDRRAWLLLTVLVSFSILSNGSNFPDDVMQWNTSVKHLAPKPLSSRAQCEDRNALRAKPAANGQRTENSNLPQCAPPPPTIVRAVRQLKRFARPVSILLQFSSVILISNTFGQYLPVTNRRSLAAS